MKADDRSFRTVRLDNRPNCEKIARRLSCVLTVVYRAAEPVNGKFNPS